jgi:nucleoid-associated protein YgaU
VARHTIGPGYAIGTTPNHSGGGRTTSKGLGPAPANARTPGPHMVNFYALDGSADITVLMGDGPAELTGGDGGWQSEPRSGADPVTWWLSPSSYAQTIPVRFDANSSQESEIAALRRLTRSPGDHRPPPVVMISGPAIERADLPWVVQSVAPAGNVIRRENDGNRIRQDMTVSLLQYGEVSVLGSTPAPTHRRPSTNKWRVRPGDNLPQIAAIVYGDARRWKEIAHANGIRDPRSLTIGRVLRIPG